MTTTITNEQYLGLSSLAYRDFSNIDVGTENARIFNLVDIGSEVGYSGLADISSWKLIDYSTNPETGFAAAAFQAPEGSNNEPGQIVFTFAGTDIHSFKDIANDFVLAMRDLPDQFDDAVEFVDHVLHVHSEVGADYSFTGHSLGGSIAQYMTYYGTVQQPPSSVNIHSVTFNAPGVGQLDELAAVNPSGFNSLITNYVNENDFIGGYGVHLGTTEYLNDMSLGYGMTQAQRVAMQEYFTITFLMATGDIPEDIGRKLLLYKGAEFFTLIFSEGRDDSLTHAHKLENMLIDNQNNSYSLASENSSGSTNAQDLINIETNIINGIDVSLEAGEFAVQVLAEGGTIILNIPDTVASGVNKAVETGYNAINGGFFNSYNIWANVTGNGNFATTNGDDIVNFINGQDNTAVTLAGNDIVHGEYNTDTTKTNIMNLGDGDDTAYGGAGVNSITGGLGDDYIEGGMSNDELYGDEGNDIIYGHEGDDYLDGGKGNDTLYAGAGNDIYAFDRDYGFDEVIVNDTEKTLFATKDTLQFAQGVSYEDISITRNSDNLFFTIKDTGDTIEFVNYYTQTHGWFHLAVQFYDNDDLMTESEITKIVGRYVGTENDDIRYGWSDQSNIMYGLEGDDKLYGSIYDDELYGGADNDILVGGAGYDILDGGSGDDILDGGGDEDTYVFGKGYKHDTILAGNGNGLVKLKDVDDLDDILIERSRSDDTNNKDDLTLTLLSTGDVLTIKSYFASTLNQPAIYLSDDTVITTQYINTQALTYWDYVGTDEIYSWDAQGNTIYGLYGDDKVYGNSGNDIFYGGSGDDELHGATGEDVLNGGLGDDALYGDAGSDTYIFEPGFGHDVIKDKDTTGSDNDIIQFGAGISPSDIEVRRTHKNEPGDRYDLQLTLMTTGETITIQDFFKQETDGSHQYRIEEVQFDDNTVWNAAYLLEQARYVDGSSDAETLYGYNDQENIIHGLDSADTIVGGGQDDYIEGGHGNDTLTGGYGDDTYVFNLGDGQDTIYESSDDHGTGSQGSEYDGGFDTLQFGSGIDPSDIIVVQGTRTDENDLSSIYSSGDLILKIDGTNDQITIPDFFHSSPYSVYSSAPIRSLEKIVFADNTTWTADYIYTTFNNLEGTSAADILNGSGAVDKIYGNAGDDTLFGGYGNDVLDGGAGDDELYGDYDNDTYIFGRGYGTDTVHEFHEHYPNDPPTDKILFNSDVLTTDIEVSRGATLTSDPAYYDLHLHIANTTDTLIVKGYFVDPTASSSGLIDQIQFADNTVWTLDDITTMLNPTPPSANVINGTSGDDFLFDTAGDDIVNAGDGNDTMIVSSGSDTLNGGNGNDSYLFLSAGFGNDTIAETGGTGDVVTLTTDYANLMFEYVNDDLKMSIYGSTDTITVQDWSVSSDNKVEVFNSYNMTTGLSSITTSLQIEQLIQAMASFSSANNGISWSQALQTQPNDVQAIVSQYWSQPA